MSSSSSSEPGAPPAYNLVVVTTLWIWYRHISMPTSKYKQKKSWPVNFSFKSVVLAVSFSSIHSVVSLTVGKIVFLLEVSASLPAEVMWDRVLDYVNRSPDADPDCADANKTRFSCSASPGFGSMVLLQYLTIQISMIINESRYCLGFISNIVFTPDICSILLDHKDVTISSSSGKTWHGIGRYLACLPRMPYASPNFSSCGGYRLLTAS